MTLTEYITSGRGRQAQLARSIGVSPSFVWQLVRGLKPVPLNLCSAIELATSGDVSRTDLRPDDWQLIWPELVDTKPMEKLHVAGFEQLRQQE